MSILIQQDDGQLIPYTEINPGWTNSLFTKDANELGSWVIDRNGRVLGRVDYEGKSIPISSEELNTAQKGISSILYGLKRGNPDALNSLDQLRTRRSVDRNPHNPYAVGSRYAPDDSPAVFIEDGSGKLAPGKPVPDQPPQYGGPLVRRQKLQEAIENSNDNNPWVGGIYGSKRPGWGLVEENPQAPVKSADKPRKQEKDRSSGNSSESDGNVYASADIPKGGVVSPATMSRTMSDDEIDAFLKEELGGNTPDNTYTGKPDHDFNIKKEGQAILDDILPQQQIDTGFDPDKAEATAALASAAYNKGAEDSNSVKASDDLGNIIEATTGGHTMDDSLYKLIKAMQDPYKADAVAKYIYSRHGDDPEVQRLGWRGWLNKYYGNSLRTKMNIDPSGYKGMHISGGL